MYVVATCGVFVVGVKCDMCTTNCNAVYTLNSIKKEFIPHCQDIFGLRVDEVKDVKVEYTCDTDSIVTALTFMDKFTDECSKVIRKKMTLALKYSITTVYTEVYKNEMLRKIEKMHETLFG